MAENASELAQAAATGAAYMTLLTALLLAASGTAILSAIVARIPGPRAVPLTDPWLLPAAVAVTFVVPAAFAVELVISAEKGMVLQNGPALASGEEGNARLV